MYKYCVPSQFKNIIIVIRLTSIALNQDDYMTERWQRRVRSTIMQQGVRVYIQKRKDMRKRSSVYPNMEVNR